MLRIFASDKFCFLLLFLGLMSLEASPLSGGLDTVSAAKGRFRELLLLSASGPSVAATLAVSFSF